MLDIRSTATEKRLSIKLKLSVSKKQIDSRLEKANLIKPDAVLHLKQKGSCTSFGRAISQRKKPVSNIQALHKIAGQNVAKFEHPFKFGEPSPFFDKIHKATNLPKPNFSVARTAVSTKSFSRGRKFSYEPQLIGNNRLREVN